MRFSRGGTDRSGSRRLQTRVSQQASMPSESHLGSVFLSTGYSPLQLGGDSDVLKAEHADAGSRYTERVPRGDARVRPVKCGWISEAAGGKQFR